MLQVQGFFRVALVGVIDFQHRTEQIVLVAEVVVEHALVDAGQCRNAVHPCAIQPVLGKLGTRSLQNARAALGRVT